MRFDRPRVVRIVRWGGIDKVIRELIEKFFYSLAGTFESRMTDTRRRVKLYALNADRQWDDRGTGHVSSPYVDRLKGISLLVRAESDGSVLLESKIQPDTAYQKQQVFIDLHQ